MIFHCHDCKEAFHASPRGRQDLRRCSRCRKALSRARFAKWKSENPELARQSQRGWQERNRERQRSLAAAWYEKNRPESLKRFARNKIRVVLPEGEFERLMAVQCGVCAICGVGPDPGRRLVIDHDHDTGAVRGLLCHFCNIRLPLVERFGQAALAYLAQSPASPVVVRVEIA